MGEVDGGVARDGGVDRGAAKDGACSSQGWGAGAVLLLCLFVRAAKKIVIPGLDISGFVFACFEFGTSIIIFCTTSTLIQFITIFTSPTLYLIDPYLHVQVDKSNLCIFSQESSFNNASYFLLAPLVLIGQHLIHY
jgi:hypothetical protein